MLPMTPCLSAFSFVAATKFSSAVAQPFFNTRSCSGVSPVSSCIWARRVVVADLPMSKLDSPSAERNKDPIWKILESNVAPTLPQGSVHILEIAAGAGVHTQYFSEKMLQLRGATFKWYPTDADESCVASTQAYVQDNKALADDVVYAPTKLTLSENGIVEKDTVSLLSKLNFDLILSINMIHISPWEATIGLMKVACNKLSKGGILFLYGPFKVGGVCVESNRYVSFGLNGSW
jgi:hypothetical protein